MLIAHSAVPGKLTLVHTPLKSALCSPSVGTWAAPPNATEQQHANGRGRRNSFSMHRLPRYSSSISTVPWRVDDLEMSIIGAPLRAG